MIITRGYISNNRSEHIERRIVTQLHLFFNIHLDLIQWHMTRSFYHNLHILFPCFKRKLTKYRQLCKLCIVTCICKAARPEAVTKTEAHVIAFAYFKYPVKVCIKRILFAMIGHPLCHDCTAATCNGRLQYLVVLTPLAWDLAILDNWRTTLTGLNL